MAEENPERVVIMASFEVNAMRYSLPTVGDTLPLQTLQGTFQGAFAIKTKLNGRVEVFGHDVTFNHIQLPTGWRGMEFAVHFPQGPPPEEPNVTIARLVRLLDDAYAEIRMLRSNNMQLLQLLRERQLVINFSNKCNMLEPPK